MAIEFTAAEIKALQKSPEALRALAAIHDLWANEADSIGEWPESVKFSEARSDELLAEAARIESEY